ncbi:MAG: LCP family protein [Eubacteriales bacterium]|nr:LCP family protein [Eubacteriales bacterium]
MSFILVVVLWKTGMVPAKYIGIASIVLTLLFASVFRSQFCYGLCKWAGMIASVLVTAVLLFGIIYINKTNEVIADVGGATYKTDNMVVVVRTENPAENLMDVKNSRFGYQTEMDQANNNLMLEDVQSTVGREIKLIEYETVIEEAQALLEGRIEAAIYNEAFTGIIEESIEDYSDRVRILYQYGVDTEIEQEEVSVEEPFHIYISGIDVSGSITTNSRSDVNIIMTVNPETKEILLTTTPRDYYVPIPNVSGDARDKLTHAGIYGVDASMNTLEQLYGIDIGYYARVNFTSLIEIVDALGGVDVNSEYTFSAGGYDFVKGVNHLDGEQALAFSRERHCFEDGDNQRGKNQEAVLTAILRKAMSPAILTSANQILESVSDCVETNMTRDEMADFINMQLNDGASWSIESTAATGRGDKQTCFSSGGALLYVMWPDDAVIGDISRKMRQVMGEE